MNQSLIGGPEIEQFGGPGFCDSTAEVEFFFPRWESALTVVEKKCPQRLASCFRSITLAPSIALGAFQTIAPIV